MSARGDGSGMARNKRNVCIALATGFRVRIGLRRNSGRHPQYFSSTILKTARIARFETARLQRNAPRPAPVVDQVMAEERATAFAKRSIKTSAKLAGLKLAVSMMDLYETVLEAVHARVGE